MRRNQIFVLLLMIASLVLYGFVENKLHNELGPQIKETETTSVINPQIMPYLSLGFENAWADWLLFNAQVYYSDHRAEGSFESGKMFKSLIEQVLELDPRNSSATMFAMYGLNGAWDLMGIADANELLANTFKKNQSNYKLPYYIAMNHYLYGEDPEQVRKWVTIALADKNAPRGWGWIAAAAMRNKSNDPVAKMQVVCNFCAGTEEKTQKEAYCNRCSYMQLAIQLNDIRKNLETRTGHPLSSLDELLASREISRLPPDPLKGRWVLHTDGEIYSTEELRLLRKKSTDVPEAATKAPHNPTPSSK